MFGFYPAPYYDPWEAVYRPARSHNKGFSSKGGRTTMRDHADALLATRELGTAGMLQGPTEACPSKQLPVWGHSTGTLPCCTRGLMVVQ
eukprot:gene1733-2075_t